MNRVDSKERLTELSLLMYDFLPTAYKAGVPKLHAVVSGIIAAAGPYGVHAAAGIHRLRAATIITTPHVVKE